MTSPIPLEGYEFDIPEEEYQPTLPKAMITMSSDAKTKFSVWLAEQVEFLLQSWQEKEETWAEQELAYRALPEPPKTRPFVGASREVIPAIAMAVDPIHARLDTAIFKNDRILRIKALDNTMQPVVDSLERFVEYYLRYYLNLRRVASPRFLEAAKHGHCVFRVEYEDDTMPVTSYTKKLDGSWEKTKRDVTRCKGPKIWGIPIQNFIYPAHYQHIQECPIVLERFYMTRAEIEAEVKRGRMVGPVDKIPTDSDRDSVVDLAQEDAAQHHTVLHANDWAKLYRFSCRYDVNGDGFQETLIGIWDHETQSILQLRYNWYHHQKYPYVLIPYTVSNGDIGSIGLCEMIEPFQRSMTAWHQQIWNNAYLANARVVVRKRQSVETPGDSMEIYAGKEYYADNPNEDVKVFAISDVWRSSQDVMQNLMGYVEKRTGVSDYLTGRESPIVGSRATATSTVALIQEGTKRVEETLENVRAGMSEIVEMCFHIWMQMGTAGLERRVFDEETANKVIQFFDSAHEMDFGSTLAIELSATDASNNRAVQQQLQLALIQTFTVFYDKLIQAGQLAMQAAGTAPPLADLVTQIMEDAKRLYTDLAVKYDVRNPEEYLPDLTTFNEAIRSVSGAAGPDGSQSPNAPPGAQGPAGPSGLPGAGALPGGVPSPIPQAGGGGNGAAGSVPIQ